LSIVILLQQKKRKTFFVERRMPFLDVGQGHRMYYEEHGNPKGIPLVVLHGGPGGGLTRKTLKLLDLKSWRVVLYDQRGCGKSTPRLELKDNTTWHLVDDLERLREHLGIEKWALMGGSWGSTLALAYASKHLDRCLAFVLRGVCLFTQEENQWTMNKGYASEIYPNNWKAFLKPLRKGTRRALRPYAKLLVSPKTRKAAVVPWTKWEHRLSHLQKQPFKADPASDEESAVLEAFYYVNNAWLTPELLLNAAKQIQVPVLLVHGRYDMNCPVASAFLLKEAVPHAKLIIPTAGHAMNEPAIQRVLRKELQALKLKIQ